MSAERFRKAIPSLFRRAVNSIATAVSGSIILHPACRASSIVPFFWVCVLRGARDGTAFALLPQRRTVQQELTHVFEFSQRRRMSLCRDHVELYFGTSKSTTGVQCAHVRSWKPFSAVWFPSKPIKSSSAVTTVSGPKICLLASHVAGVVPDQSRLTFLNFPNVGESLCAAVGEHRGKKMRHEHVITLWDLEATHTHTHTSTVHVRSEYRHQRVSSCPCVDRVDEIVFTPSSSTRVFSIASFCRSRRRISRRCDCRNCIFINRYSHFFYNNHDHGETKTSIRLACAS